VKYVKFRVVLFVQSETPSQSNVIRRAQECWESLCAIYLGFFFLSRQKKSNPCKLNRVFPNLHTISWILLFDNVDGLAAVEECSRKKPSKLINLSLCESLKKAFVPDAIASQSFHFPTKQSSSAQTIKPLMEWENCAYHVSKSFQFCVIFPETLYRSRCHFISSWNFHPKTLPLRRRQSPEIRITLISGHQEKRDLFTFNNNFASSSTPRWGLTRSSTSTFIMSFSLLFFLRKNGHLLPRRFIVQSRSINSLFVLACLILVVFNHRRLLVFAFVVMMEFFSEIGYLVSLFVCTDCLLLAPKTLLCFRFVVVWVCDDILGLPL
jgi:hypothetical protein